MNSGSRAMDSAAKEEARRAACTALAMGHHPRLGVGSILMTTPPEMMHLIQAQF